MSVPMHARNLSRQPSHEPTLIPTARVNLLPPEIETGRHVRRIKRRSLLALLAVLVLAVLAYGWFRFDEARAGSALGEAEGTVAMLRAEQMRFGELPRIEVITRNIDRSLGQVMINDAAWDRYLAVILSSAPAGVALTSIDIAVDDVAAEETGGSLSGSGPLDASGEEHVGVLTITGRAPDHDTAAAWLAQLETIDGFRVPYLLGSRLVVGGGDAIEFTIEVTLTEAIRTLRYAAPAPGATEAAAAAAGSSAGTDGTGD